MSLIQLAWYGFPLGIVWIIAFNIWPRLVFWWFQAESEIVKITLGEIAAEHPDSIAATSLRLVNSIDKSIFSEGISSIGFSRFTARMAVNCGVVRQWVIQTPTDFEIKAINAYNRYAAALYSFGVFGGIVTAALVIPFMPIRWLRYFWLTCHVHFFRSQFSQYTAAVANSRIQLATQRVAVQILASL